METIPNDFVCVVDDDKSVLRAVSRLLLSNGLSTKSFFSPLEFVEYAKSHRVPVAILDFNMPEMSGLDVFNWLRLKSPESRVIFISASDGSLCRAVVMAQGATAFFSKPFIDENFISCVQTALSRASRLG